MQPESLGRYFLRAAMEQGYIQDMAFFKGGYGALLARWSAAFGCVPCAHAVHDAARSCAVHAINHAHQPCAVHASSAHVIRGDSHDGRRGLPGKASTAPPMRSI